MRLAIPLTGLAALLLTFGWAGTASAQPFPAAQDTVDFSSTTPNALFNAIQGDTTATGARINPKRVYRLARGKRYLFSSSLRGTYAINVVSAKKTAADPNSVPPIIQTQANTGGFPLESIANTQGDMTFKGIYFLAPSPTGPTSFYLIISTGNNVNLTFDDCTIEYTTGVAIEFRGIGSSVYITNSRFRNLVNPDQIYAGRAVFFTTAGNATTPGARNVIIENNTFNTIGGFIFQGPRGGEAVEVEKFRFNHNTIFNVGNYPFLEEQWTDAQLTNNLIVNGQLYGETVKERTGQDPEKLAYGIFNVNRLRAGQATAEANRRIGVVANANFRDPRFDAYYASTPAGDATKVNAAPFFNSRTQDLFNSRASFVVDRLYQGMAPGFTNAPDNIPQFIQFRKDVLMNPRPATLANYAYDPDGSKNTVTWPLPENFSYSNATFKTGGINGYPLGDLNWYPTEKAAWQRAGGGTTDQAETAKLISNAAFTTRAAFAEAEDVTLDGVKVLSSGDRGPSDANASGGKYVYMEAAGSLTWTFNAATAGSYVIRIRYQVPFSEKAQKLTINGVAIPPNRPGRGDFFFSEPIEIWQTVDVPVTLTAGSNVFKIEKSFGYQYFDSFEALSLTTAGEAAPEQADGFEVSNSFPNPTTGRAQVRMTLAEAAQVGVKVYDLLGRQVLTVAETTMGAGANQTISLDASSLPGGTYVYRVEARQGGDVKTATGRLTVIR